MKSILTLLTLTFFFILTGCSKTDAPVISQQQQDVNYLVGIGNKVWHLKQVYIQTVPQTLTDAQMKYTKTYTLDPTSPFAGSFTDSDGFTGTWKLNASRELKETIINNPAGSIQILWDVNDITDGKLDIQYTQNLKTVRHVYYAY